MDSGSICKVWKLETHVSIPFLCFRFISGTSGNILKNQKEVSRFQKSSRSPGSSPFLVNINLCEKGDSSSKVLLKLLEHLVFVLVVLLLDNSPCHFDVLNLLRYYPN